MRVRANTDTTVEATFTNANGFMAEVEGDIAWASSNPSIATVEVDPDDPYFATVHALSTAGSAVISATGDADLGEGVTPVSASLSVEVVARGVAVGGEIRPVSAEQGLPDLPETPDNELPTPGAPSVDNELPVLPTRPDNTLPDALTAEPKS